VRIPKRIDPVPIIDATAEVRFYTDVPPDAVVGVVYTQLQEEFGSPEPTPIAQLPPEVRNASPALAHLPLHRLAGKGFLLQLGPRTLALSAQPFTDWRAIATKLSYVVETLAKVGLFNRVERASLRLVNAFEGINIFEHSNLALSLSNRSLAKENITLRVESNKGEFIFVVHVLNNATHEKAGGKVGSVLDIDVIYPNPPQAAGNAWNDILTPIFDSAFKEAEEMFFSVLKTEFVATLNPEY
jgi:uncharacterized protein (TIGR04255 family)